MKEGATTVIETYVARRCRPSSSLCTHAYAPRPQVYAEYEFLEELGKGSYGVVSRVRRRYGGDIMAVKHIDKRAAGAKVCV